MTEISMNRNNKNAVIILAQILIWAWLILTPWTISFMIGNSRHESMRILLITFTHTLPLLIIYLANFLLLVPELMFRKKKILWFLLINAALIIILDAAIYVQKILNANLPVEEQTRMYIAIVGFSFMIILCIATAVGMRYIMRWNDLQIKIREKKLKSAEAEVRWLKYQLNPHFLFNTLNNISSLTQIDADKAQENIGQLSDLLRYAIYDSNQQRVELEGEVEFMNNYISLMRLRCNEMTTIENDMKLPGKPVKIAPLLFISLIENAFKHGVNSRRESFVRIRLELVGNDLVFTCENSYFSNNSLNRIGSGIGLENMKRRLELLYHDNYEYISVIKDETYTAKVTIRNIT